MPKCRKKSGKAEAAVPKKKRSKFKKLVFVGILAAVGGVAYSKVKEQTTGPAYTPPAG
ncbi:MAG: hypothetical protein QM597_06660 [Aeromicrobium sp.]|uniref:hypothetical protein n=1 Tax=Aeromicrobium sp. TaxID=1871063 RepID=UPI0039E23B07